MTVTHDNIVDVKKKIDGLLYECKSCTKNNQWQEAQSRTFKKIAVLKRIA